LHFTRETDESVALNRITGGAVIIAGSGMCNGGRIRHHLKHNLARSNWAVIFVGYAAQGTLGRRIIDGLASVSLFGEDVPVRVRVYTINGFSAHADQAELLKWHRHTLAGRTYLVHGDVEVMGRFAAQLRATDVHMPQLHEGFNLWGDGSDSQNGQTSGPGDEYGCGPRTGWPVVESSDVQPGPVAALFWRPHRSRRDHRRGSESLWC
jgi:hypothetical protein